MKYENIPIIIVTVIITALVVGGGMYWWQLSALGMLKEESSQKNNELQQRVANLQNKLNQAITERDGLQQQINKLTKEPERYVKIISPNGGETLCLNDESIIKWESKGVKTISLRVIKQAFGNTNYYYIGLNAVPATYNEAGIPGKGVATWKVKNIPVGDGYKIEIMSAETPAVSDTSDGTFSIILCKG